MPCERDPIALPAGQQELLVSPGAQFVVDGAELTAPSSPKPHGPYVFRHGGPGVRLAAKSGARLGHAPGTGHPGKHQSGLGGAHQRRGTLDADRRQRVAAGLGGARGRPGHHHADFASNSVYRAGLAVGLALLPVLAMLALWRTRKDDATAPALPWRPGAWAAVPALAAAG